LVDKQKGRGNVPGLWCIYLMQNVILYTKANCGLCDQAYRILLELTGDIPLRIDLVDITRNDRVHAKYMERIPVLARPDIDAELNWPFTAEDIKIYLDKLDVMKELKQ
jgi:hypothetical protein